MTPGIVDSGKGKKFRTLFGVYAEDAVEPVKALALASGIPESALFIEVRNARPRTMATLSDKFRPKFVAGILAWTSLECSMGFNVTDSVGTAYFLTASHCIGYAGASGAPFYQKNFITDYVGYEAINPAWSTGSCSWGVSYCRAGDVALVTIDTASMLNKEVAITTTVGTGNNQGSTTISVQRTVINPLDMWIGAIVTKTGMKSGSTQGYVVSTCANIVMNAGAIELTCGDIVQARADGGDSGGPVFRYPGTPYVTTVRQPHGIVSGGVYYPSPFNYSEFFYTTWSVLQSDLGRTLYPD